MIGIYKITTPSGKIYIGQSVNLARRFNCYKRLDCKRQPYIYNSILKYGIENHKFEIIEECLIEFLNEREIFYIKLYDTFNTKHGLNLREGGKHFNKMSDESKLKLSNSLKGKPKYNSRGKKHSDETKAKISYANSIRVISNETRIKMSIAKRNISNETRDKMSQTAKNKPFNKNFTTKGLPAKNRLMIKHIDNLGNVKIYESLLECSKSIGLSTSSISFHINGKLKRVKDYSLTKL